MLLAGTRRDEVQGGAQALKELSSKFLKALRQRCAPAIAGLQIDTATGLCFFGIENSKGFVGDATIRNVRNGRSRTHDLSSARC